MKLKIPELELDELPLSNFQQNLLLASPNAMSAFVYYAKRLPDSTYLRVLVSGSFAGAVHLEPLENGRIVTIHPMLLERDREMFTVITEAAILWCLNAQLIPTAQVLNISKYHYMHEFLISLGFEWQVVNEWRIYTLPMNWKPSSFSTYTMEFTP